MQRRDFLKYSGMMLGAAGVGAAGLPLSGRATMDTKYEAAILSEKPVFRPDGWKGARVKTLDYPGGVFDINNPQQVDLANCTSLGTTKIVGPVASRRELDGGFMIFDTDGYGSKAEMREKAGAQYFSPLGIAIAMTARRTGFEEDVDGAPRAEKLPIPDPTTMARHLKDVAMYLGADDCGIGIIPKQAIFTHQAATHEDMKLKGVAQSYEKPVTNTHPLAIVMLYNQDYRIGTMSSDGYDGGTYGARRAYLYSGLNANVMARYIRHLGYEARAHHNENYHVMVPPVMISAGLGELSRAGECVLHPYLGYNFKVSIVTTNIPVVPDKPIDFGLQDFCRVCKKCAEHCPAKAISHLDEPVIHNGYMRYPLDAKACTIFRRLQPEGYGCGRCAVVCPWANKEDSWFHQVGTYLSSMKSDAMNRLIVQMDDMLGYGTEVATEYKSWLGYPGKS